MLEAHSLPPSMTNSSPSSETVAVVRFGLRM